MDAKIRNLVRRRANQCCEYCRLPDYADPYAVFHIEHVIARQHAGDDDPTNLAWSCSRCNHRKGTNLASRDPDTGKTVLVFNPREQEWYEHFYFQNAIIVGLTPIGRATVRLDMNDVRRVHLRRELIKAGELSTDASDA
jgi:hypothetical protein